MGVKSAKSEQRFRSVRIISRDFYREQNVTHYNALLDLCDPPGGFFFFLFFFFLSFFLLAYAPRCYMTQMLLFIRVLLIDVSINNKLFGNRHKFHVSPKRRA